jgi:DNA invertase Pin-like site-specific DNA recombinase
MLVVLYIRVSTQDQDFDGQERALREEAARRGWEIVRVYSEKVSGTGKVERREYDRLLRDARAPGRSWSILFVWSLDRFSREERFTRAVETIWDLEGLGIAFASLREPYLDTPAQGERNLGRELLLGILPTIAAFEAIRRSERVRVAMRDIKEGRRRTRSGRPPGRPRRVTPEKTAWIVRLRGEGSSWSNIAQRVELPAGTCRAEYSLWRKKSSVVCVSSQTPTEDTQTGSDGPTSQETT